MKTTSIQLSIESRLENVPLIGAALRGLCRAVALSPQDSRAMELRIETIDDVNVIQISDRLEAANRKEFKKSVDARLADQQMSKPMASIRWRSRSWPKQV